MRLCLDLSVRPPPPIRFRVRVRVEVRVWLRVSPQLWVIGRHLS